MKHYIAEARLPEQKLKKLIGGAVITVNPNDIANSANRYVKLQFNKLKDLNKFGKNLRLGKNVRVSPLHLNDITDAVGGGSLLTNALLGLKKIGDKLGKPFEKTTTVNPFTAGYDLGHDVIAPALMKNGIGPKYKGKGIGGKIDTKKAIETIKKGAKMAAKKVLKDTKSVYKNNKGAINNIGRELVATAMDAMNGEATGKDFGHKIVDSGKQLGHVAARDRLDHYKVMKADNYNHGQFKKVVDIPNEVPNIEGSGLDLGLGGFRLVNNGRVNGVSVAQRMAHARSFRKAKVGGSFIPV